MKPQAATPHSDIDGQEWTWALVPIQRLLSEKSRLYCEPNFDFTHKHTNACTGKDAQRASARWFTKGFLDDWTPGAFKFLKMFN